MSLTSTPLAWTVIAAALLVMVVVVVIWPRLSPPGALHVVGRLASLVGVQAVVVLALLVVANDTFDFYSSFADLAGHQAPLTIRTSGAPSTPHQRPATLALGSPRAVTDPGTPVPGSGGRVEQLTLSGSTSQMEASALVLLPIGYHDPSQAHRSYPVIEAFHGYPGSPEQWLGAMDLQAHLDAAVAARDIAPTIVVIPDLAVPAGRDTECLNGPPGQPQLETWLTHDLPADISADFRVDPAPGAWATTGFSMGGWCAAMAAMLHPTQYAAAMVFGGYFRYDPGAWKPYPSGSAQALRDDLVTLARTDPPAVALWAQTARTDPSSYPSTTMLGTAARPPMSVTLAIAATGGHRTGLWAAQLPTALGWLGRTVPAFSPR